MSQNSKKRSLQIYDSTRLPTEAEKQIQNQTTSNEPQKLFKTQLNAASHPEEIKQSVENYLKDLEMPVPFYLNKLIHYPTEEQTEYMFNLDDIMYEIPFFKRNSLPKYIKKIFLERNMRKPAWSAEAIFLTSYGFQFETLEEILSHEGVHFVLANDGGDQKANIQKRFMGHANATLLTPPKDTSTPWSGAFHPKLWLIRFPTFLRVVVSSGNLYTQDWSVWSNCHFYQDFMHKSIVEANAAVQKVAQAENFNFDNDFKETLKHFVQSIMPFRKDYRELLQIDLDAYHFCDVRVVLIPSLPGRCMGERMSKVGKCKVQHLLHSVLKPAQRFRKATLTYQTSSLGALDLKFLENLLQCFSGETVVQTKKPLELQQKLRDRVRIIFPSTHYIQQESILGEQAASPIILSQKNFLKDKFPKDIFYKFEAQENYFYHTGIIPHLKVFILTDEDNAITDDTIIYYGSHNLTQAAWGRSEKKGEQIFILNSELGVLLPPMPGSKQMKQEIIMHRLPFKFPPRRYEAGEVPYQRLQE